MCGIAGLSRFRHDPENYVNKVEECVDESLTNVYNNEQGSTIRFTKHNPAHDNLRQELFAQLDAAPVSLNLLPLDNVQWTFNVAKD